jgi:hypothetical protein
MSMTAVPIGEAARQSGVKAPTIRYTSRSGFCPPLRAAKGTVASTKPTICGGWPSSGTPAN